MIAIAALAAVIAALAYGACFRLQPAKRELVALLAFLVPLLGMAAILAAVGDRALPGAIDVDECARLMRVYEGDTANVKSRQRLDDTCPGWESMR